MKRTVLADELEEGFPYKYVTSVVVPRPIAWVGSRSAESQDNLAPFSFFTAVSFAPPMVMFCPVGQPMMRKDTLNNVRETGVFTVSLVPEELAGLMNETSAAFEDGVSEFEAVGLKAVEGTAVAASWVEESPVALECELHEIHEAGNGRMVVGLVKAFHLEEDLYDGHRIVSSRIDAVARMGGIEYSRTSDPFTMTRPE